MPANPQVTDEMVEKAARAIYEGRNGKGCKPWSLQTKSHKEPYLSDAIAALEAALADHVESWRDIESAPKDGSEILVAGVNSGKQFYRAIAKWDGAWMQFDPMMDDYTAESSGHKWWAPLPAAPLPQKEG